MVGTAGRAATPGYSARILLQRFDEISHRLQRRIRRNDDGFIFAGQAGDRGDVIERYRRLVGEDGADHDVATDDQGIGIAGRLAGELGKTDRAAGAGHVLNLDVAGNAFGLHHRLDRAGRLVPAAARIGRCDDGVVSSDSRQGKSAGENGCQKKLFQGVVLRQARSLCGAHRVHLCGRGWLTVLIGCSGLKGSPLGRVW
jgi:hypothetical protein